MHMHARTYIHERIPARVRLPFPNPVILLASTGSCYLLCVLVRMCLAAASRQSKNGLLVGFPPSQPCGRSAPVPLTLASGCGTAVLLDGV